MLKKKVKKLNEMVAINFENLTDPAVVAISQEVDKEINKEMYRRLAALKDVQAKG